jgi:poly-gamma-glutamate synthesis protein (capsule biosynthesis protein)
MGDRKVGAFIDKNGGAPLFESVKPFMEDAHLAFINLEGPISDTGTRNSAKEYTFRARPGLLDGLLSAGIDVVSLGNNHVLDYGSKALTDCIARLDAAGIAHAGAGADLEAASTPASLDTPAGRVSLISVSQITAGFAATSKRAGTYYVSSASSSRDALIAKVSEASGQTDFLIVSLHWGTEYDSTANSAEISLAHALVDAGADLVLGHHPHVIQGLEIYKDKLIAYSLGDFVWDWHSAYTGEAFVLRVTIPADGPPWGTVVPVYLSKTTGAPGVSTGDTAARILDRLTKISAAHGLELVRDGDVATFGTPLPGTAQQPTSTTTTVGPAGSSTAPAGSTTSTTTGTTAAPATL